MVTALLQTRPQGLLGRWDEGRSRVPNAEPPGPQGLLPSTVCAARGEPTGALDLQF